MHQIITDQKLYTNVLNQAFDKWEAQRNPQTSNIDSSKKGQHSAEGAAQVKGCRVSIKSDLKFLDATMPNQEDIAANTSGTIRTIIANLAEKYEGKNIIENAEK